MEPRLHGPAQLAACPQCSQQYAFGVDTFTPSRPALCYHCGAVCEVTGETVPGQAVEVQPLTATTRLSRWDIIAFRSPEAGRVQIKRIWGLPSEQLTIRDGELWVNGRWLQKELHEAVALAIPVAELPTFPSGLWRKEKAEHSTVTDTVETDVFCRHPVDLSADEHLIWTYALPVPTGAERLSLASKKSSALAGELQPSVLVDDWPGNQGASYAYQPVRDWGVFLRMKAFAAPLVLRMSTGGDVIEVKVVPASYPPTEVTNGSAKAAPSAMPAAPAARRAATAPLAPAHQPLTLTTRTWMWIFRCDGRLLMGSDVSGPRAYAWSADFRHPTAPTQLMVQASGPVTIERLRIVRDLYLRTTHRDGGGVEDFGRLGSEDYFVVGDNLPVSDDSRGTMGAVPRSRILGSVILSASPAARPALAPWAGSSLRWPGSADAAE
ncbi:MAG: hypothetical protein KatS3mg111_0980 [Pirellulaceae bacterium]|nr:MAG: hypothetical protein KatS3mg111_0980 [Pirellulaceae bacterium]